MTRHLSHREFVDFIEASSTLPAKRVRHVDVCPQCREEAETLRAVLSTVNADGTPEPSPLFWDHFAARVSNELRHEPALVPRRPWTSRPLATWAAAAAITVLLISTLVWRTTLHAPAPHTAVQTAAVTGDARVVDMSDDLENDEAWAVVRAAAADLAWEDVHDAGITAHPGEVENEAMQLDAVERTELARLLNEDLKRNGA